MSHCSFIIIPMSKFAADGRCFIAVILHFLFFFSFARIFQPKFRTVFSKPIAVSFREKGGTFS